LETIIQSLALMLAFAVQASSIRRNWQGVNLTCRYYTRPEPHDNFELNGISNLVDVEGMFVTAGQPSEEHLHEIVAHGFDVVVNLGLLDPRYCLLDEAASVATLGMSYHHIPVNFQHPTIADFDRFRDVMNGLRGQAVFVHCAMNYRVSCFAALFGEAELGWSRAQADAYIGRVWEPNGTWSRFLASVRSEFMGV
jgi:protein tyrosine phosphatase (PTP) superfamily phosphohydrolase (DUF442 family)